MDWRWLAWMTPVALLACKSDPPPEFESQCVALPRLPQPSIVVLETAYDTNVEGAIALVEHPTQSRFYLVVKSGQIYTFTPDDTSLDEVVDIEDALVIAGEAGLLDLALHPDFASNRLAYLSYNAPRGGDEMLSRISRVQFSDDFLTIDRASEITILEVDQPYSNHNGGDIGFGPDGMLYIGFGDGGSAGDPQGHGQDTDTTLGSMLRIDVDAAEPYAIPPDNPFAQGGGAPEIHAWGFRNPWRWSFDRETGELWVGDVGQHRWEEVDKVVRGGNYGWGLKEGPDCIGVDTCDGDFVDPVAAYRNSSSASVVAGAVVRGGSIGAIEGSFVYSDFYDGTIWRIPADVSAPAEVIGSGARMISSWTLARDGSLLGTDYRGGIVRLAAGDPMPPEVDFPRKLSQTGCIDTSDPTTPLPWLVPYELNLPFWSDGADKQRMVAVPQGDRGRVGDDGVVRWPVGTVLVKSFEHEGALVETRLLVNHGDAWVGYGYAWDDDGLDATLVEDETLGDTGWIFPGLRGCPACHTDESGGPLGTTGPQLARTITRDGNEVDQLDDLVARGVLEDPGSVTPLPADDAPLDDRVRAYLDVNCSSCHRDEGTGGRASLDLRREVALSDTGLCGEPSAGDLGIADARIVVPGDTERSILLARIGAPGDARMPPLATAIVDEQGVELVRSWIEQLASCP